MTVSSVGVDDDEALGFKLLVVGEAFLEVDLSMLEVDGFVIGVGVVEVWLCGILEIILHLALHGDLLKGFHFSFAHGIISAIVVEDHGVLVGALIGLVASTAASETFEGARLDGLIGRG